MQASAGMSASYRLGNKCTHTVSGYTSRRYSQPVQMIVQRLKQAPTLIANPARVWQTAASRLLFFD